MIIFIIIALVILFLLLAGGLAGYLCACLRRERLFDPALLPKDSPRTIYAQECLMCVENLNKLPHIDLTIEARDRKKLHACLFPNGQSEQFVLLLHGYHSSPAYDFGAIAQFYLRCGYGLLLVTQRAHGKSEGRLITYGAKERYDCRDWCVELSRRYPGSAIMLHGISMGGATAILCADTGLPENVKGIVDDCGYTNPLEEIAHVAKTSLHLPHFIIHFINLYSLLLAHCSLKTLSVAETAAACSLPKLFIHGEADTFVPYEMGRQNYQAAAEPKRFVGIPEARHAMSYFTDRKTVEAELAHFAEQTIGRARPSAEPDTAHSK